LDELKQAAKEHNSKENKKELTLDPEDWDELRRLGHRMMDVMFDNLEGVRERPVWQTVPAGVRTALEGEAVPFEGQGAEAAFGDFVEKVLPYPMGNTHPRYFGWVKGTGTPLGMLADMLASGLNPQMSGFDQAPRLVEEQTLRWLAELMGFPATASGLLTSGGSMANLLGLNVGRFAKAGFDVRGEGLAGEAQLRVYCSAETHSWVWKTAELLGLGRAGVCVIGVDSEYRMRVDELKQAIAADRATGLRPFCVIGTAGTVNTGATDDLAALAEVCREEELWFHVDGAFGALAYWSEELRPALRGMELADSLAFDLHKWGSMPFEVGCVLVRDAEVHRAAFASTASYLTVMERGPAAGGLVFADRGIELTRGFKALKVWMSLKAHGVNAIRLLVEQNVGQARYMAELIDAHGELELMAPVALNVVCFRFQCKGLTEAELNELNTEVLLRVQESGVAVPSSTVLQERFVIRAAIVNHRSRREDFDLLVKAVVETGRTVAAEMLVQA
jgi:aromatic-L-amino-acid/L-tryptophan decarboxylase